MEIKNMYILGSSHGIYFQVYPQTTFLVTHIYTNIQIHKHKITKLAWNHMVHTCNIHAFDILTG